MALYGTTSEQFGAVAVTTSHHASYNPKALRPLPITIEDHQASRMVSTPLRLLDCCMESDHAAAIILAPREAARDHPHRGVGILASASRTALGISTIHGYDSYPSANMRTMAPDLWERAGLRPSDVDVAQIYDCFTSNVLMAYEDLGFCERGEGGPFVESGAGSWPHGSIPTNTSGGMLADVYTVGMNLVTEGVRQIRGDSSCQVVGAETCLLAGSHMSALILATI
jgi:acetyl-CoA acetyltransferase